MQSPEKILAVKHAEAIALARQELMSKAIRYRKYQIIISPVVNQKNSYNYVIDDGVYIQSYVGFASWKEALIDAIAKIDQWDYSSLISNHCLADSEYLLALKQVNQF